MDIDVAVRAKLVAVLGPAFGGRVYPDAYPQPKKAFAGRNPLFPCAVYYRVGDQSPAPLDGSPTAWRKDVFAVELWSDLRSECRAGRNLLREAFRGANARGRWGADGAEPGLFVTGATASDATGEGLPPVQGDEELDRAERVVLTVNWKKS